jgi:hypothetical protein
MDLNRIIQALKGTIDPKLRIAAENELNQVRSRPAAAAALPPWRGVSSLLPSLHSSGLGTPRLRSAGSSEPRPTVRAPTAPAHLLAASASPGPVSSPPGLQPLLGFEEAWDFFPANALTWGREWENSPRIQI